jgi:hypothetical protein
VARSGTGVVRVAAIPLLIWLCRRCSNHAAAASSRGFPSLSKEGTLIVDFRDRNWASARGGYHARACDGAIALAPR